MPSYSSPVVYLSFALEIDLSVLSVEVVLGMWIEILYMRGKDENHLSETDTFNNIEQLLKYLIHSLHLWRV